MSNIQGWNKFTNEIPRIYKKVFACLDDERIIKGYVLNNSFDEYFFHSKEGPYGHHAMYLLDGFNYREMPAIVRNLYSNKKVTHWSNIDLSDTSIDKSKITNEEINKNPKRYGFNLWLSRQEDAKYYEDKLNFKIDSEDNPKFEININNFDQCSAFQSYKFWWLKNRMNYENCSHDELFKIVYDIDDDLQFMTYIDVDAFVAKELELDDDS